MQALKLVMLLVVFASLGLSYTADDFFKTLDANTVDLTGGSAEFTYYNAEPVDKAATAGIVDFSVLSNNTPLLTKTVYIWAETVSTIPVWEDVKVTKTCSDNKTGSYDCSYVHSIVTGNKSVSTWGWQTFKGQALKSGQTYRFKVVATWKARTGGVVMDWVPSAKLSTAGSVTQSKWAWWNASWTMRRSLTITNTTIMHSQNISVTITSGNINDNCYDLRVLNSLEDTVIPHYRVTNGVGTCTVLFFANETSYYIYYGNPGAADTSNATLNYLAWSTATDVYVMNETSGTPLNYGPGTYWGALNDPSGTVPYSAGKLYGARGPYAAANHFSGTGKTLHDGNDAFTITGWFKVNATPDSDNYLVTQDTGGGGTYAYWFFWNDGTKEWYFRQAASGSGINCGVAKADTLVQGKWYFVVAAHKADGTCELSVNNSAYTSSAGDTVGTAGTTFSIGIIAPSDSTGPADEFKTEQIALWNSELTANQISWLWNGGNGRDFPQKITYALGEESGEVTVNSVYPITGTTNTTNNIYFGWNVTSAGAGLIKSCALYTNLSGAWGQTRLNTSAVSNTSTNSIYYEFANPGAYLWSMRCDGDYGNISYSANRTLTLTEHSTSYVTPAYEITSYPYNITFTFSNYTYSNVKLIYNNTVVPAANSTSTFWYATAISPLIPSNGSTVNLYWTFNRTNSSGIYSGSSAASAQTLYYSYAPTSTGFNVTTLQEGQTVLAWVKLWNVSSLATLTTSWFWEGATQYTGTTGITSGVINASRGFTPASPTLPSESRNYTWSATVYYGGASRTQTIATGNISINKLTVTACGDGNQTARVYMAHDEDTWGYLPSANYYAIVKVYNGITSQTYSFNKSNALNLSICVYPSDITYTADISLLYSANTSYPQRTWYEFGTTLNNQTVTQKVFLLNNTNSYATTLKTYDNDMGVAKNVHILVQKWNYSGNAYVNVTSLYTSSYGEAFTYLQRYDTPYKLILLETDGTVLNTYLDFFITTTPVYLITSTVSTDTYNKLKSVVVDCNFENATRLLTCDYLDAGYYLENINLRVFEAKLYNYVTVCNENQTAHSGTFTCDLSASNSSVGYNVYVTGTVDGIEWVLYNTEISGQKPAGYGGNGLIYAFMLILTLAIFGALMGPTPAAIMIVLGLLISVWADFILVGDATTKTAISGFVLILGIIIIWLGRD